jgi:hypothetical protein
LVQNPYITKMEKNSNGTFQIEGMFAEVFLALQV